MSGDELIGHIIQVIADDLWLRADPKTSLPTRLISAAFQPAATAKRVPCMARDETGCEGSTASSLSTA